MSDPEKPERNTVQHAVDHIADMQQRAAKVRFRPADPLLEKPSEVTRQFVVDFGKQVELALGPGKLVVSRREVQFKHGDLTFCYSFSAASQNAAGVNVVVYPEASVASRNLQVWRRGKPWSLMAGRMDDWQRPRQDTGVFLRGMLGNFFEPKTFLSVDLLTPANRARAVDEMVARYGEVDRRLKAWLAGQDAFISFVLSPRNEVLCWARDACEYICSTWGPVALGDFAHRLLSSIPGGYALFQRHYQAVRANPRTADVEPQISDISRFFAAHDLSPEAISNRSA